MTEALSHFSHCPALRGPRGSQLRGQTGPKRDSLLVKSFIAFSHVNGWELRNIFLPQRVSANGVQLGGRSMGCEKRSNHRNLCIFNTVSKE